MQQTKPAFGLYGTASRSATANGTDDGRSAETYALWLYSPGYARHRGGGRAPRQGRRQAADLPLSKGDSDLALRFGLTVPLAKYVALHYGELSFPFRRYQIGKVYRGERAQRGRFREFYQADIDIIGDGKLSILNEAEIPAIIYQIFTRLGLKRFQIRVNNRKVLNGFYESLGLTAHAGDIMRTVDKLDKIGPEKVRTLLTEEVGISAEQAEEILRFMAIRGDVLPVLEQYRGRSETFDTGLDELRAVVTHLGDFGVPAEALCRGLTIARGLDYYTGTVYETICPTIRKSARFAPAAAMTTWRATTLISLCPAWASPSA